MTGKTQTENNRKTANYNLNTRKANQLRSDYLAQSAAGLRRSIAKAIPAIIERIMVRA